MRQIDSNKQQKDPNIEIRNPGDVEGQYVGDDAAEENAGEDADELAHGGRGVGGYDGVLFGLEGVPTQLRPLKVGVQRVPNET